MTSDRNAWTTADGDATATSTAQDVLDSARRARLIHRSAVDGTDQQSVRVSTMANDELLSRIAGNVQQQLCQIVVAFAAHRRPRDRFAQVVLRDLVRARRSVRRLYLVPSGQAGDEAVRRQVESDESWGCESAVLAVGTQAEIPMDDVWLIDESAVVKRDPAPAGGPAWVVSTRPAEVTESLEFWEKLWREGSLSGNAVVPQYPPDLTARLLISAPKIREVASVLCQGGHVGRDHESCSWYHGIWQYLRLFNMVSNPGWHADFYHRQLTRLIHTEKYRRVLISGCADYSTLAFVIAAARMGGDQIKITPHVLDRCQTALAACTWYAKEVRAGVHTHQVDITNTEKTVRELGVGSGEPFDMIVADAFLTRFDRGQADRVVGTWSALLRPGGRVVTTVRLHPRNVDPYDIDPAEGPHSTGRPAGDPIGNFQLRLRRRAEPWRSVLKIDIDDLCDAAREYATNMISNDMGDNDDIVTVFERHNFDIEDKSIAEKDGELVRTSYLRLVARKRK